MKVLQGIKVLDFGRFIAGPYCAALLADYGADVIRVDRVGGGEDRFVMPVTEQGDGAFFLQVNRNKRSMTLDLECEKGRQIVREMIKRVDVVIANMPPRTLENLGLDYPSLIKINPNIILTASTAFGNNPEVRDRVGFDGVGQSISGAVHMAGFPDQPVKSMVPYVDFGTALACALGTVLALFERDRSGKGQEVSASLLQTGLTFSSGALIEEALLGINRQAMLNRAASYAPSDIFRVKDGWIIVQIIGQAIFKRWTKLVGMPELADDLRFVDDHSRGEHGEFLSDCMSKWCANFTREEALHHLEQARIPSGPVNSPCQTLKDKTVLAADAISWINYPGSSTKVPLFRTPVTMSRTPPEIDCRPPLIGEHTDSILLELGYDKNELSCFRSEGVI